MRTPHLATARRRRWLWAPVLSLLMPLAAPVAAHQPSDAFVTWRIEGMRIEQRLDIALRDLDRELALDADGDGALTWGEVRSRWPQIQRLADEGVRASVADRACEPVAPAAARLDTHAGGVHAVLLQTLVCPGPAAATSLDYRLFVRSDPTHRGLLRVDTGPDAAPAVQVLVPGAGPRAVVQQGGATGGAGSPGGFLLEGLRHIAAGADHVLFIAVLVLTAAWRREAGGWVPGSGTGAAWRETLRLVTAFTVAHSVTLGLAAAGVLAPAAEVIEPLIALSVLVTAIDNVRPFLPGPRWGAVAAFGLLHGFGFAGPLQALGLTRDDLALPLLAFNVGVELGQLAIVAALLPAVLVMYRQPAYSRWVVRPASLAVALLALVWTAQRTAASVA